MKIASFLPCIPFFLLVSCSQPEVATGPSPKFHHDFQSAMSEAQSSGKPVITIFSASWCGPCQSMKKEVYPSSAVVPYHDSFVWAYLDTDDPNNAPLATRYGVSGIPHIAFLSPDGSELGRTVGFMSPDPFAKKLGNVLKQVN